MLFSELFSVIGSRASQSGARLPISNWVIGNRVIWKICPITDWSDWGVIAPP